MSEASAFSKIEGAFDHVSLVFPIINADVRKVVQVFYQPALRPHEPAEAVSVHHRSGGLQLGGPTPPSFLPGAVGPLLPRDLLRSIDES